MKSFKLLQMMHYHFQPSKLQVRESVTRYGVERTDQNLNRGAAAAPTAASYVSQMPKTVCTFTNLRKLYLLPGVQIQNSPEMFANVPNQVVTRIEPLLGKLTPLIWMLI